MPVPFEEWVYRGPLRALQLAAHIPKEEAAWVTSEDWCIFAIHGNFVRPRRDWGWYPGEPCRLKSFASGKMFELPPGSVPYSLNSLGHPATSWDPFVFPNPPRAFLMSQHTPPPFNNGLVRVRHQGNPDEKLHYFRRRIQPPQGIPPIELADLERQLWFDPEPRFEKPFRTYADSKYCSKGVKSLAISELVRPGW